MSWFTSTSSDETAADTPARISRLEWIYIRGVYFPATRRARDPANWYPSFKAAIDGLTDKKRKGQVLTVGVLSDDSDEHVVGPDMRLGVQEHPRIRLDLYAGDAADQAAEVERLVSLGPSASTGIFIRTMPTSSC